MKIIRNIIKTPDGTILESTNRHDYTSYVDSNGETYINDGGKDYLRRSRNIEPFEDLSVYSTDDIERIRTYFQWGTYGKNGDQELKVKVLSELSNAHIEAIIETQKHLDDEIIDIFKRELQYRDEKDIFIED